MVVKVKTILVHYLKEDNMKIKSKAYRKLKDQHEYLNRKVKELTEDRKKDRSSESKTILMRLKKASTSWLKLSQNIFADTLML